jgi:putative ABC transport system ATP-binding protein
MVLFQELNAQGITIVLVTHERDIARYTKRLVELRDGHVIRDVAVADRGNAAEDLKTLADVNKEEAV